MKRDELKARLKQYGWRVLKEGSKHEIWTNGKGVTDRLSRSPGEVPTFVVESLLKKARNNPG